MPTKKADGTDVTSTDIKPNADFNSVLAVGQYVNTAELEKYPTFTKDVDHFEVDGTDGSHTTDVYDVVSLTLPTKKFDGYSLEYILNGYNIVTLCPNDPVSPSHGYLDEYGPGDLLMKNHFMGGALIRGDIIHQAGTGIADSEMITKPTVIGGYVPENGASFINNRQNNNHNWNGYVGTVNTVVGDVVNGVKADA